MEAYEAAMVLSGVGDALGYRAGRWEYCTSGPQIHAELAQLGGLAAISLEPPEWPVSDDTVLHLATAEGLATGAGQKGLGWGPHGAPGWHYTGVCPLGVSPRGWGVPALLLGLPGGVWECGWLSPYSPGWYQGGSHYIPGSNWRIVGRSSGRALGHLRSTSPQVLGVSREAWGDVYPYLLWIPRLVVWGL